METKLGKKMSRRDFLRYGAAGVGAMALGGSKTAIGQAKKPILIGITSDASGNFADSGTAERRGILMAIDEFNAKGGVLGRKIEYKHEDTETDPSTAALIRLPMKIVTGRTLPLMQTTICLAVPWGHG